jgi:hypothetical protein
MGWDELMLGAVKREQFHESSGRFAYGDCESGKREIRIAANAAWRLVRHEGSLSLPGNRTPMIAKSCSQLRSASGFKAQLCYLASKWSALDSPRPFAALCMAAC